MKLIDPFRGNIEKLTLKNHKYRKVIHTTDQSQLVLMSLKPGEYIHKETHPITTQFIRIERGQGIAIIDDIRKILRDNIAIVIPAGSSHKITNTSKTKSLQLYTIYSPPEHPISLVQNRMPKEKSK